MEILNQFIITAATIIILLWALRKKREMKSYNVSVEEHLNSGEISNRVRKNLTKDTEELDYVSEILYNISKILFKKIAIYSLIIVTIASILVMLGFEENIGEFAQAIWFFIGAYSQIIINYVLFYNHNLFDKKIIIISRVSKWLAMDYLIKLNCYVTLVNQGQNLAFFSVTYYTSAHILIGSATNSEDGKDYEKFHRRFLAYGLGSIFMYFMIKSLTNVFSSGSKIVYEILDRGSQEGERIEEEHPRNPAKIMSNLSDSFLKTFEICCEHNAQTNIGIILFQDFFVTKSVFLTDRGWLNSIAILAFGQLGCLFAIITFRRLSKIKKSDANDYESWLFNNGFFIIFFSAATTTAMSSLVFYNTYPDSIAVFNPFDLDIARRGIDWVSSFLIMASAFQIIFTLSLNSFVFTGPSSFARKDMAETSRISQSLNILKSEYYSCYATILPMIVMFGVVYVAYEIANIFGITLLYLGLITYYQIMQFFMNFKQIYYFPQTVLMAGKNELDYIKELQEENFNEIIMFSDYYGKFSNGVSLFVSKILCFTVMIDSFNMYMVDNVNILNPDNLFSMIGGVFILITLTSLDMYGLDYFVKVFRKEIRDKIINYINEPEFEPPLEDISGGLITKIFWNQLFTLYVPVITTVLLILYYIGEVGTNIILFGSFIWILMTGYPTIMKVELLNDNTLIWSEKPKINLDEVSSGYKVKDISSKIAHVYKNYSADPQSKILIQSVAMLACSSFFIGKENAITGAINMVMTPFTDKLQQGKTP